MAANQIAGFAADDYANYGLWTGSVDGGPSFPKNDPLLTGYGQVRWISIPAWVEAVFANKNPKPFLAANMKSFQGLEDIGLDTESVTTGFNANEYKVAGGTKKGNSQFSMKFQEYSGSPIRSLFQYWQFGIRDPETGIATYPTQTGGRYGAAEHAGSLLYIATRPDAQNLDGNNIEFAAYYTNVYPMNVPLQHLNYEQGQRGQVELDIQFSGTFHISDKVTKFAYETLRTTNFQWRALGDFDRPNGF